MTHYRTPPCHSTVFDDIKIVAGLNHKLDYTELRNFQIVAFYYWRLGISNFYFVANNKKSVGRKVSK